MMKSDSQRFGWGSQVNKIEVHHPNNQVLNCSILADFKKLDSKIVCQAGMYRYISDASTSVYLGCADPVDPGPMGP